MEKKVKTTKQKRITYIFSPVKDLSTNMKRELAKLHNNGNMNTYFQGYKESSRLKDSDDAYYRYGYDKKTSKELNEYKIAAAIDSNTGRVVGWCNVDCVEYNNRKKSFTGNINVFVKKRYRKSGIGKKLMYVLTHNLKSGEYHVYRGWDDDSPASIFFRSFLQDTSKCDLKLTELKRNLNKHECITNWKNGVGKKPRR